MYSEESNGNMDSAKYLNNIIYDIEMTCGCVCIPTEGIYFYA